MKHSSRLALVLLAFAMPPFARAEGGYTVTFIPTGTHTVDVQDGHLLVDNNIVELRDRNNASIGTAAMSGSEGKITVADGTPGALNYGGHFFTLYNTDGQVAYQAGTEFSSDVVLNVEDYAAPGNPPVVRVSCDVNLEGDRIDVAIAGPDDRDGVADVAICADETAAGDPVWSTNGVTMAAGRARFSVFPVEGVLPGQYVFATYLPNDKYDGTTVSNRVMVSSRLSEEVDGVVWFYQPNGDGETATATGAEMVGGGGVSGILTMPERLGGLRVTGIAANAFEGSRELTAMTIPAGVVEVGAAAFANCRKLAVLRVPSFLKDADWGIDAANIATFPTQLVTFDPAGGTCAVARASYRIGQPYGWLPEATWPQHTFDGWWAPEEVSGDTNAYDVVYDLVPQGKDYAAAPANGEGRNVYRATAGETLTIDWTVKNDPGTAGIQFYLDFSPVEYVSARIGNGYRVQPQFNDTNAKVSKGEDPTVGGVVAYAFGGDSEKTARDGAVIYSFTVKAPEREGIYSIVKDDRSQTKVVPKDQSRPHAVLVHGLDIVVGDPAPDEPVVLAEVTTNSVVTAEAARLLRARWAALPPVVSNVVARQRWPWNGLVDVDYEVGGTTTGLVARISFEEQGGGGRVWVATNFLAGAEPTAEPGEHRATWDTAADGVTNVVAANVVATVSLVDPRRNEPGPAPSSEPSASEDQSPIRGDVDCSGDVDVADAVLLARYLAEDSGAHVSAQGILNADVNGSGFPDSTDLTTILKYIVHLIAEL